LAGIQDDQVIGKLLLGERPRGKSTHRDHRADDDGHEPQPPVVWTIRRHDCFARHVSVLLGIRRVPRRTRTAAGQRADG
jgi:hypothetical protein